METIIPSNSIKFLNPIPLPLVLIFEELAKVQQLDEVAKTQGPDKSQLLQLQAAEVAALWKEKIAIKAPRSSLEALAFLMSIMAFGLKTLINEEEAALLAWSIAQYEQAPMLFEYLSISLTIREVVEELIKKSEYISAVRLICLFKLDKEVSFSPSELLKKEIISFRGSALENRSNESSQAKEKDDGRLRAILELVADYQIGIDLPGDLIAKLMVQGERSAPVVRFSVEHDTSSSTSQAELKKKQLGGTETVLVRHTGVDEENLGTTLPADVNPSNETSNGNHPPLIHTYHRRRN
ncbi:FRIGIDA-like protein 1 [Brassica napus]|uniref:FRIGIDA-like protein 1 n=1 Tax=Brassica napus TaxID=3708 RepID=UPI00207A3757|nr:FRIGIDA-like protein 1 [Brassica napus]